MSIRKKQQGQLTIEYVDGCIYDCIESMMTSESLKAIEIDGESIEVLLQVRPSLIMKLFEVVERTIMDSDRKPRIVFTTKVTGKWQIYFINKFVPSSQMMRV